MIVFSTHKNRKHYEQYEPKDDLEAYMVKNNNKTLAVEYPTHVSQRGGYYMMEDVIDINKAWYSTLGKGQEFYMEEFRATIFRLHLDIDVKLTEKKPFSIIENGWLSLIQSFVSEYFSDPNDCILTESHGDWNDAVTKSAVYKSGFRLYFTKIYVDRATFKDFIEKLVQFLGKQALSYKFQPKDWKITDVIDTEIITHDRARMFGSTKWRRGKILGRIYTFHGSFRNGNMMESFTTYLNENLYELLQFTLINLDNSKDEFFDSFGITIHSNAKKQESIAHLNHMENKSITID